MKVTFYQGTQAVQDERTEWELGKQILWPQFPPTLSFLLAKPKWKPEDLGAHWYNPCQSASLDSEQGGEGWRLDLEEE